MTENEKLIIESLSVIKKQVLKIEQLMNADLTRIKTPDDVLNILEVALDGIDVIYPGQLKDILAAENKTATVKRMADAVKTLGYESRVMRVNGVNSRCWVKSDRPVI